MEFEDTVEIAISTQFTLEQDILTCWNIIDDLRFFCEGSETWSEDERQNYLIGLIVKYDKRFEKTFKTFEDYLKEYHGWV